MACSDATSEIVNPNLVGNTYKNFSDAFPPRQDNSTCFDKESWNDDVPPLLSKRWHLLKIDA